MKEIQRYNILVLINHHQDLEKMISSVIRSMMDVIDQMTLDIIFSKFRWWSIKTETL